MKTRFFILTLLAAMFTLTGNAAKIPTMKVESVDSGKALVAFDPGVAKNFEVTIKDSRGEILYYKKTETAQTDFKTVFDFSELESGIYTLCINFDNCTIYRDLVMENRKMKVGNEIRTFDPYFRLENDKLYLSHLNPALKNVYLNVYENGEQVDHKKLGNELAIHKCLDLSLLEKGDYEFIVSDRFNAHSFTVNK